MYFILATEITFADFVPVIVEILVTAGVIFGGTGYWQYKQAKEQAKRDAASKENGVEKKVDTLIENVSVLNGTVDQLKGNVSELKEDIILLQKANEETVKYREFRDASDKEALQVQHAVIESLKGLMRERLLDVYNKCQEKGYYSKEEREVYKPLYECYKSAPFRGNGVMDDLDQIMVKLPMTEVEAKKMKDDKSS